jgi:hypothetical protein
MDRFSAGDAPSGQLLQKCHYLRFRCTAFHLLGSAVGPLATAASTVARVVASWLDRSGELAGTVQWFLMGRRYNRVGTSLHKD